MNEVLALDRRSLALFRMALGAALLVDLLARAKDLRAFYTDDGVLPRDAWLQISDSFAGSVVGELVLFLLAGAAAVGLMLGFRPRACAAASYFLLLSVHYRNPLVSDYGDWTLLATLVWASFLPLSTPRWPWERFEGPARVRSVATAALLAQLLLLYATSAAHKVKVAGLWAHGTVLPAVLQLRSMSTPAGLWLSERPGLCAVLSWTTLVLELLGPLLLFVPWRTGVARMVAVCAFIGLHLSMLLFLRLGLFTLDSVVPWLAILPGVFWTRVLRGQPEGEGVADDPLPLWARRLALGLLAVVALWSVGSASAAAGRLERLRPVVSVFGLAHVWNMFAAAEYRDAWFRAPAVLASGARVDLLTGEAPIEGPPADPAKSFGDRRWRNYQGQLVGDGVAKELWAAWANWLCTRDKGSAEAPVEVQIERMIVRRRGEPAEREVMISGQCQR